MPASSSRLSVAPQRPKVNLYCLNCEAQIGIFNNEWIRLTSSYAWSKEGGLHFGTDLGRKTQLVPSGAAQKAAEGCAMVEVFCNTCHNVIGQNCKSAPSKDKDHLVGRYFYKLSRVFLKDTQAFHLVDPIFGFGGDLAQPKQPRSNRVSSGRLSETDGATKDQPLRSSQSSSGRLMSSPAETQNGTNDSVRSASECPASHQGEITGNKATRRSNVDNGSRPCSSVYRRNEDHSRQQEATATFDCTTPLEGGKTTARQASMQPPSQDYVIQYVPRHIYEDRSAFSSPVYSRAASSQPLRYSDGQMALTDTTACMRLQSVPADTMMYTPSPKTLFLNDGRAPSVGPQSPGVALTGTTANRAEDEYARANVDMLHMIPKVPIVGNEFKTELHAAQSDLTLNRIGDQDRKIGQQEYRLNDLNGKLDSVQHEMQYIRSLLEDLRNDRINPDAQIDPISKITRKAGTESSAQHLLAVEALQAENDDLKARLGGIAQAMGIAPPSPTGRGSKPTIGTISETPMSIGKRKRTDKYGPNKRSSLQHEILFTDEIAQSADSIVKANSLGLSDLPDREFQGFPGPNADTSPYLSPSRSSIVKDHGPWDSSGASSGSIAVRNPEAALIVAAGDDGNGIASESPDGGCPDQYDKQSGEIMGDTTERPRQEIAEDVNGQVQDEEETTTDESYVDDGNTGNPEEKVLVENQQSYGEPLDFSDDEESTTARSALTHEKIGRSHVPSRNIDLVSSGSEEVLQPPKTNNKSAMDMDPPGKSRPTKEHLRRRRSVVIPGRRITDIVPDRDSRSMAPEPAKTRKSMPARPRTVDMGIASHVTPEMIEHRMHNRGPPKEPLKPRVQTTERLLHQELEDFGLAHWIGKDKSTPEYRRAVDEARQAVRERTRLAMLAGKGIRASSAPLLLKEADKVEVVDLTTRISSDLMGKTPLFKVGLRDSQHRPGQDRPDSVPPLTWRDDTQSQGSLKDSSHQGTFLSASSRDVPSLRQPSNRLNDQLAPLGPHTAQERLCQNRPISSAPGGGQSRVNVGTLAADEGYQTGRSSQCQSTEEIADQLMREADLVLSRGDEVLQSTSFLRHVHKTSALDTSNSDPATAQVPATTAQSRQNPGEQPVKAAESAADPVPKEARPDPPVDAETASNPKSAAAKKQGAKERPKTTDLPSLDTSLTLEATKTLAKASRASRAARRSSARQAQETVAVGAVSNGEFMAETSSVVTTEISKHNDVEPANENSPNTSQPNIETTAEEPGSIRTRRQQRRSYVKDKKPRKVAATPSPSTRRASKDQEAQKRPTEPQTDEAQQPEEVEEHTEVAPDQLPYPTFPRSINRSRKSASTITPVAAPPSDMVQKPAQTEVLKERVNEQDTTEQQQHRKTREDRKKLFDRMAMEAMAREEEMGS